MYCGLFGQEVDIMRGFVERLSCVRADSVTRKGITFILLYSELWARNAYGCKTKNV